MASFKEKDRGINLDSCGPFSPICIVDVGLGNIASVRRMLQKVGANSIVAKKPEDLLGAEKFILPGVGHFDEGMRQLRKTGFAQHLINLALEPNVRMLGICLGMQIFCRNSAEGTLPGLGLVDADVVKFRFSEHDRLKVPHMGWNVVLSPKANPLLPLNQEEQRFYFVHSYKVVPDDNEIVIGVANYGSDFCAAFQKGNIFGVQFHPEKSHRFGMELMRRFVGL